MLCYGHNVSNPQTLDPPFRLWTTFVFIFIFVIFAFFAYPHGLPLRTYKWTSFLFYFYGLLLHYIFFDYPIMDSSLPH
jgi:hypothetical protein